MPAAVAHCDLCSGTGYSIEYIGPGHNPVPLGEVPCPDCADERGRELDRAYAMGLEFSEKGESV